MEKTITVTLPETTFQRLKQAAQLAQRSIDDMMLTTIDVILTITPQLPPEWAAMHLLSDEALWQATKPAITLAEQKRLHDLNHLAGERPLTLQEATEQQALLETYQRSLVQRSQSLAILKLRGHAISPDRMASLNEPISNS